MAGSLEFWNIPRESIRVSEEIGRGGWGVVAKGVFRGQKVAVKWPHRAILNPRNIERLRREVRILAQVRHPNLVLFIAAVFDEKAHRIEESPMIITELLDMDLRKAYEQDKLEKSNKFTVFQDVACALNYLHQHNEAIVHRDVSAPNVLLEVLLNNKFRAKLSDFGSANLAKVAQTAGEGAIIYTAPEAFPVRDPKAVVPRQTTKVDVFSYGVLLCEVITDQFPDQDEYHGMLQQVQRQWPPMYNLIISCTKTDPTQRPTMDGVLKELRRLPQPRSNWRDPTVEVAQLKLENQQYQAQLEQAEHTQRSLVAQLEHSQRAFTDQLQQAESTQQALTNRLQQSEHTEQSLREELRQAEVTEQVLRRRVYEAEQALTEYVQQSERTEQALREQLQQERAQSQRKEEKHREQVEQLQHQLTMSAISTGKSGSHQRNVQPKATVPELSKVPNCQPHEQFDIWSTIQMGEPPHYGVIRWIGELPGVEGLVAGVELEEDVKEGCDGTWRPTGVRYFRCSKRQGMFAPIGTLKPDERFMDTGPNLKATVKKNPLGDAEYEVKGPCVDIGRHPFQIRRYIGERRGIQGHESSSFIDAALFGLFALTEVFDIVFSKWMGDRLKRDIQRALQEGIVNPLRRNGIVRFESVLTLQNKLKELNTIRELGLTEDPKVFLERLFEYALDVKPFIAVREQRHAFIDTEHEQFFVQISKSLAKGLNITSVESLLTLFVLTGNSLTVPKTTPIKSLRDLPSKLLICLPRGNSCSKIIPSLELNITSLRLLTEVLFKDEDGISSLYRHVKLQSVICAEGTHYVCFAQSQGQWVFFDSMAKTVDDTYSIPKVVDCTRELNEWVYNNKDPNHHRLMNTPTQKVPEYVRRFTRDVYICVYIVPDI